MKTSASLTIICLSLASLNLTTAFATEREAAMIDCLGIEMTAFDEGSLVCGILNGETDIPGSSLDLALLVDLRIGEIDIDKGDGGDLFSAGLGMKYYRTENNSLSVMASLDKISMDTESSVAAVSALAKYRLISADESVSPYLLAGIALQGMNEPWWPSKYHDNVTEIELTAGAGCDIEFTPGIALVIQSTYSFSSELSGDESSPDLLSTTISLKGYLN